MLVTSIFSFFPQCFLPFPKQVLIFHSNLFCHLQMLSIWTSLRFCHLVELKLSCKDNLFIHTIMFGKKKKEFRMPSISPIWVKQFKYFLSMTEMRGRIRRQFWGQRVLALNFQECARWRKSIRCVDVVSPFFIEHIICYSLQMLNILTLYQTTKNLDVTKKKAFAHNKIKVAKMRISLYDRVENTVGKGENAGNQHFLLFPQCFPKLACGNEFKALLIHSVQMIKTFLFHCVQMIKALLNHCVQMIKHSLCPDDKNTTYSLCPHDKNIPFSLCSDDKNITYSLCPDDKNTTYSLCPDDKYTTYSLCPDDKNIMVVSHTFMCFLAFSHQYNTTFLFKANDCFSHMHQVRGEKSSKWNIAATRVCI